LIGREITDAHRQRMDEADFAGKGRSFPIETPEDVSNAAQSIGRAGDDNYDSRTLKKNIVSIAKRKGPAYTAAMPDPWKKELAASDAEAASDHANGLSSRAHSRTADARITDAAEDHRAVAEGHAAAAVAHHSAGPLQASAGDAKAAAYHDRMAKGHEDAAAERLAACSGMVAASDGQPRILILIGAAAEKNGLARIPVALITRGYKGKQKFAVTAADLRDIVANFRKKDTDVPVDWEHSTLRAADGQPVPTAGWLKAIDDAPDAQGVLWGGVDYTDKGRASVVARDYKYASPVVEWGRRDKRTGELQGATLTSVALTKQPLFESLPELPLVASDSDGWSFSRGDVVEEREQNVKITKVIAAAAGKVRLVADDNTEAEFEVQGAAAVLTMADVKRTGDGKWDFSTLGQNKEALIATEVLRAMDVQELIDRALHAGKITPAQRGFYETAGLADVHGLHTLIASMGMAVDFSEHGTGADGRALPRSLAEIEGQVDELVAKKRTANPKMAYGQALKLVANENKGLFRRRETLIAQEER
jgi:phage I-like protein